MQMTKLRLKLLLLAIAGALALAAVAQAATFSTAKTNSAFAQPSPSNTSVFDLALGMRETSDDVVDETNSATANSTCDGCRSVAIAFQVVIVQGNPTDVRPLNIALAVNEQCSNCTAMALAHQFVVGRGEPVRITSSGRRQLAAVGDDLLTLERSYRKYTDTEIKARADADAAKVRSILKTELVPVDGDGEPDIEDDRQARRAA
jgi:hypothetical protein